MSLESFTSVFTSIFYFAIVLGLAVIFHEWGHFIVAKLVGAKVDEFAVGFGRKLCKYTWRNTEYSLRALPLGGLVKIRGMDPDEELTGAEWEYLQLAPWRRMLIVVAGPFMNFVLAYLLYVLVLFCYGLAYNAATTVGHVPVGSWGWELGLHDGDRIVAINGVEVSSWGDITVQQSRDVIKDRNQLVLTVERNGKQINRSKKVPEYIRNEKLQIASAAPPDVFEGIYVSAILPGSVAERAGLKPGISILSMDGIPIENRTQFSDYIATRFEKAGDQYQPQDLTLAYKTPKGTTHTITLTPELILPAQDAIPYQPKPMIGISYDGETTIQEYLMPRLDTLGIAPKLKPIVGTVKEDSPAEQAGLTPNCRIVEVNGEAIDDWVDFLSVLYSSPITKQDDTYTAEPITLTWLSPDKQMHTESITPQVTLQNILTSTSMKTGKRYPLPSIGVDLKPDRKRIGVLGAVTGGWNKMNRVFGFMFNFLGQLFTGNVSPKLLGGPIAIYQISGESGRWGWEKFMDFIALLSINLGILNLFPFPPFDGAHAVIYSFEYIRRKPVTMKQMETFGKIGFALIIPLFIFLIYNDLARADIFTWVKGWIFPK